MSIRQNLEVVENDAITLLLKDVIISGGIDPTGTITITENGTVNVKQYKYAAVNVPEPTGTITITENGTVNVKEYEYAAVNVPEPTGTITITENGTVNVKEYEYASVSVPGIVPTGTITITENGTVDVTNYANANINVDITKLCETPRGSNFQQGYLSQSGNNILWNYYSAASDVSDEYEVIANHTYVLFTGAHYGNRWIAGIFANSVYDNRTTGQTAQQTLGIYNSNTEPHANIFKANNNGYLVVQKTSENDMTIKSYLIDVTNLS